MRVQGSRVPPGINAVAPVQALRYDGAALWAIDQTRLPGETTELELHDAEAVAAAIRRLAIRGAPLIGVAAGYGVALALARDPDGLDTAASLLTDARPTAANLGHAVRRVAAAARRADRRDAAAAALAEARSLHAEETAASAAMGVHGADLLAGARRVLTHCNTGALAAPGRGTALAAIYELHARGGLEHVLVCETRPLLQGARLTAWELGRAGIVHALIVDGAAAGLIAAGEVDAVLVGCDRVAANGDVANKVGTYAHALAAAATGIPFVVIGPTTTIDPGCDDGSAIVIEQRDPAEVSSVAGQILTPAGTSCRNPAFDVTPARLITALVTERGVAAPPDRASVAALLARA
ncbi:MAG TPA: S-methyl-5-thioribose-1-phosphate isomerase [Solirubrobacteraceae bacterium]|nr:S-methyl-5-thioribose-1-phosphate isomerase [Solirubrobacteraceae bacterium]